MKSKCINASRRTAFYFVKFRAVRARKFPVLSGRGKQYYQVLTNYTLSEKKKIPSFVSPAASLKTIPRLVESQRTIFERVRRVE